MAFTSPYSAEEQVVNAHVAKHGDGVKDVAFLVEDAKGIYNRAVSSGAVSVKEPEVIKDENGSVLIAAV